MNASPETLLAYILQQNEMLLSEINKLRLEVGSLKNLLGDRVPPEPEEVWLPMGKAVASLRHQGVNHSKAMQFFMNIGVFQEGVHYRNGSLECSTRARWEFNIPKCDEAIRKYKRLSIDDRRVVNGRF
jgi:hypothetical protein